jgi:Zn-dependent protease
MIELLFSNPVAFFRLLILLIPGFLVGVTVHEFAHGWVADRLGDPTARLQGRLTLNPLPHIDPLGAIAIFLAGFGWAKPVPVNAFNLRHPVRDMAWVAAAGPISNFLAAFLALLVLQFMPHLALQPFLQDPLEGVFVAIYKINLMLGVFNLIPLPPLDGGHFLPYFLPRGSRWTVLNQIEQIGPFILILLVISGVISRVMNPLIRLISEFYLWLVGLIV